MCYGIFLSCNGNQIDLDQDIDIIEVVTSDPNDNTFFYNFLTNEERDDIWQLSYSAQIAEQSLILPSVDLSDKILLYVEETIAFDDIVSAPSSTLFFQGKNNYHTKVIMKFLFMIMELKVLRYLKIVSLSMIRHRKEHLS